MSTFTFNSEKYALNPVICEGRQFSVICHVEAILNKDTLTFCTWPTLDTNTYIYMVEISKVVHINNYIKVNPKLYVV